jgi:hypothetical protein
MADLQVLLDYRLSMSDIRQTMSDLSGVAHPGVER